MALITCPDCGTEVSDQAPACPKCARPLEKSVGAHLRSGVTARGAGGAISRTLFFGIVVLMILYTAACGFSCFNTIGAADEIPKGGAESTGFLLGMGLSWLMIFGVWAVGIVVLGVIALVVKPRHQL